MQSFLDFSCDIWGHARPRRVPLWVIYLAARFFELTSKLFDAKSPLTKDFIDIGRVSYYGDTSRFRTELLPELKHRLVHEGIEEMRA